MGRRRHHKEALGGNNQKTMGKANNGRHHHQSANSKDHTPLANTGTNVPNKSANHPDTKANDTLDTATDNTASGTTADHACLASQLRCFQPNGGNYSPGTNYADSSTARSNGNRSYRLLR